MFRNYIKAIYSPFDFLKICNMSVEKVKHKWFDDSIPIIINVGRLIKQKIKICFRSIQFGQENRSGKINNNR